VSFGEDVAALVERSSDPVLVKSPSWKRVPLGEVASVLNGYPWKSESFTKSDGVPLIRIRDVTKGDTETRYTGPIVDGFWIEEGDLLVGMDGDFNVRRWRGERGLLNQRVSKITADPAAYDSELLGYVLPGYLRVINKMTSSVTVKHLSSRTLAEIPLPLPPRAEQSRIVAKLDSLTARLARARAELERAQHLVARFRDEARASAYTGELTRDLRDGREASWPLQRLQAIAQIETGSTPPTADKTRLFGGDIPFFKPTDLDAGYSVSVPRETLTVAGAARSRVVPAGATLVTCIGATIAKTGFARVRCAFNQQINAVVPNAGQVEPRWLYWAITAPAFRASIIDNASATTMPIINKARFQALELPMPPLHEQATIADRLEAAFARADRLEAEAAHARALLDRLEAAILARAFRGELVPQDPNDEPASALLARIRAQREAAPKAKRGRRAGNRQSGLGA
jgi:type I restriction enzyme S subunit